MNKKLLSEKLNKLSKPELAVLQRIMFSIETRFYNIRGEKHADFFGIDRFGNVDKFELYRMARMLNEDFCLVHMHERSDGPGFSVFFNDSRNYSDFMDFKKVVDNELNRNDGTNALELYRPTKFKNNELSGGMTGNKLQIKKENSHEFKLLQVAFDHPVMKALDVLDFENDDLSFQQIYDTARRLNKKIKQELKIENFFQFDYPNRRIMRKV